jgi:hypothetical protein
LTADQARSLTGALIAFSKDESVQQLVIDAMTRPKATLETRLLLLESWRAAG